MSTVSRSSVVLAILFVGMAAWTWGRLADVNVDFGQNLYVAWRLSEGDLLYRDLAWPYGPLSVYVHAAIMRLSQPMMLTVVLFNLCLTALLAGLIHAVARRAANRTAADLATACFLLLFAFAQFVQGGNFNYVCAYLYELPHGIALALAALYSLHMAHESGRWPWASLGGLLIGGAFLTKIEVFAALVPALLGILVLALKSGRTRWLLPATLSSMVPIGVTFVLFTVSVGPFEAAHYMMSPYALAFTGEPMTLARYRRDIGFDDPFMNLWRLVEVTACYGLALAPGVALSFVETRSLWRARSLLVAQGILAASLLLLVPTFAWMQLGRPLPLFVAGVTIATFVHAWRSRSSVAVLQFSVAAFALGLLAKMILNARLYHYGFGLAMPATLVLVVVLVGWAPTLVARLGGRGELFKAYAMWMIAAVVVAHLRVQKPHMDLKTRWIDRSGWSLRTGDSAEPMNTAVELISKTPPETTLVTLPDTGLLNFLTLRRSSTAQLYYTPFGMKLVGETAVAEHFAKAPPDVVVWFKSRGMGLGTTFARELASYIEGHYRPVAEIAPARGLTADDGVTILARTPP